jgi:hypothetical protein
MRQATTGCNNRAGQAEQDSRALQTAAGDAGVMNDNAAGCCRACLLVASACLL